MKLSWLGHSSFLLEESTGTRVVVDPYENTVGFEMPTVTADVVTVSHEHKDHSCVSKVDGSPTILNKMGVFDIGGVRMFSAKTYHDNKKGEKRGKNLLFRYRMDGVDLCHLGDIGEECSPMLAEIVAPVNILMIPVGGRYTIDAETAKDYIDKIMPDIVVPMHYKTRESDYNIAKLSDFLDLFDESDIVWANESTLEFDRADFDGESTKVLVMKKFE